MHHLRLLAFALVSLACGSSPKPEPTPPTPSSTPSAVAATAPPPVESSSVHASAEEPPASAPATSSGSSGDTDPKEALAAAKKDGKPTFLVFCAKWVAACGELSNTLGDSAVKKTLEERFVVARVDVSNDEDPATKERMKRYNVKGLPLMIVFDRKGKEVARETSYVDSSRLVKLLEKAK